MYLTQKELLKGWEETSPPGSASWYEPSGEPLNSLKALRESMKLPRQVVSIRSRIHLDRLIEIENGLGVPPRPFELQSLCDVFKIRKENEPSYAEYKATKGKSPYKRYDKNAAPAARNPLNPEDKNSGTFPKNPTPSSVSTKNTPYQTSMTRSAKTRSTKVLSVKELTSKEFSSKEISSKELTSQYLSTSKLTTNNQIANLTTSTPRSNTLRVKPISAHPLSGSPLSGAPLRVSTLDLTKLPSPLNILKD